MCFSPYPIIIFKKILILNQKAESQFLIHNLKNTILDKWQPFQYSCLGNAMDREAWWATAHEVAKKSWIGLSD